MIWGGAFSVLFALLSIMALVQFAILRHTFRKNPPDCPFPLSVNAGESFSLSLDIDVPFLFPGFRTLWRSSLGWEKGHRRLESSVSPGRRGTLSTLIFSHPERGVYTGPAGELFLEDLFGFFSLPLYSGEPVTLYVYPGLNGNDFEESQVVAGGDKATDELSRLRSDELLEVRKYYPGDDARRINWKLYASTGEMFLRIGEEIPPPSGEALIALLADSPLVASLSSATTLTDRLIDRLLSLVKRFHEKGCRVQLLISGKNSILYDPENPDQLLAALSSITASALPPVIPECDFLYTVALTGSGTLLDLPQSRKGETKVYLLPPSPKGESLSLKSELLFQKGKISRILADYRGEQLLEMSYNGNRSFLGKAGKGRIHVDGL